MNENEQAFAPDFSDVPALGDTQGLENYLNNAALAAQGLPTDANANANANVSAAAAGTPTDANAQGGDATNATGAQPAQTYTKEQVEAIVKATLARQQQQQAAAARQQAAPNANAAGGYTPQEQQFIAEALKRGYGLSQIQQVIMQNRAKNGMNPQANATDRRVAAIEEYLRNQQYQAAQNAFIERAGAFAEKWGLSDADLEVFATEALKYGINIADEKVNLEMVFRAIYPQQYAIRSQRMSPTNASQIYGGTSIPEGSRANASKVEDAYVEAFLKGTMPNQYAASNKK